MYRTLRWIHIALALITLLAYLSPHISPDLFWPFAFLGLLLPWLMLVHLLAFLGWLLAGRKEFLLSLVILALGWTFARRLLAVFPAHTEYAGKTELIVTTFNTHAMIDQRGKPEWVDMETQWAPFPPLNLGDVLCLQEFARSGNKRTAYLKWIAEETSMKYQLYEPGHGLVICSSYPLSKVGSRSFNQNNGYLIADMRIGSRTVRLINAHLQSNDVSTLARDVVEDGRIQEKETWLQLKGMAGRYRRAAGMRARQAEEIRKLMDESPHPVILCGDLNDVPTSYVYQQLARGQTDSFREAGMGLGVTYRGKIPGLRIDYILAPPTFHVSLHQATDISFSDHRAVHAILRMD